MGGDARLARVKNPARDRAAPEGAGMGKGGGQVRVHVFIVDDGLDKSNRAMKEKSKNYYTHQVAIVRQCGRGPGYGAQLGPGPARRGSFPELARNLRPPPP